MIWIAEADMRRVVAEVTLHGFSEPVLEVVVPSEVLGILASSAAVEMLAFLVEEEQLGEVEGVENPYYPAEEPFVSVVPVLQPACLVVEAKPVFLEEAEILIQEDAVELL